MKKIIFSLFLIIIFSGVAVAQIPNNCEQFTGIVIPASEDIDKGFVKEIDNRSKAKGIVVNPCLQKPIIVREKLSAKTPIFGVPAANPFQLNKREPQIFSQRLSGMKLQLPKKTRELFNKPGKF